VSKLGQKQLSMKIKGTPVFVNRILTLRRRGLGDLSFGPVVLSGASGGDIFEQKMPMVRGELPGQVA